MSLIGSEEYVRSYKEVNRSMYVMYVRMIYVNVIMINKIMTTGPWTPGISISEYSVLHKRPYNVCMHV